MARLTLLRHGQSVWNLENRFTGWVDVDLTDKGVAEAKSAGEHLKDIPVDVLFTSVLKRAMRTADEEELMQAISVDRMTSHVTCAFSTSTRPN